jgi:FkbM family methyltransferase
VANTQNGLLVVDPHDFNVSRALLAQGAYDWSEVCWLSGLLHEESRMVFVGAHIGALLVPLALRSGSRAIVAFEPSPRNFTLLKMNLALNGLTAVAACQRAVGAEAGSVRFTENRLNTGNSRLSELGEVVVEMTTLDAALSSAKIDLLVMDTEGSEARAIQGAPRSLNQTRYLYVEYGPEQLVEQGSSPAAFIDLVASHFGSMYLPGTSSTDPPGKNATFFPSRTYVRYLRELPSHRGLLLNLLFSNDTEANGALLETPAPVTPR